MSVISRPFWVHVTSASSEWNLLVHDVKADFVKFMEDERKKREQVVKTLQNLRHKVRLNHSQCDYIIDLYSTFELPILHPEHHLANIIEGFDRVNSVDENGSKDPMSISQDEHEDDASLKAMFHFLKDLKSRTSSLKALFHELYRIMCHGEILVRECTCENWIRGALTEVTIVSQKDWSIVTPFSLHVQKLHWILKAIWRVIVDLQSLPFWNYQRPFGFEPKEFSITPRSWEIDIQSDRQQLVDKLLELLNAAPPSKESETSQQLERFIVWRLQGRKSVPLPDPQSSESSLNVIGESERFGRNQMYSLGRLGSGAFGTVFKRRWLGIEVAVKELDHINEVIFAKEVEFAELQHPHVIQTLDYWIGDRATIVMELMDMDLRSFMEKHFSNEYPPVSWAIELMHQLAEAMRYLWDNNIAHRDLKPMNVLVRKCPCGGEKCIIIKLADFGESKSVDPQGSGFDTVRGTPDYMAPEVKRQGRAAGQGYTPTADVYSFAITCSEILTGKHPVLVPNEDVTEGLRPALPAHCPFLLRAYLQRCWAAKSEERPQHPSEICEFLLYCKQNLVKDELYSIDDYDVKVLLTHFGIKWCLEKPDIFIGKYSTMHERIMDAIHDGTWTELEDVTESELLVAANYFGNWSGDRHQYGKAIDILRRLEGPSADAEGSLANVEGASARAEATWRLGYCFELGLGVSDIDSWHESQVVAASLYEKACDMDPKFASSYVELGRCYATGRGRKRSWKLASIYWEKALQCEGSLQSTAEQFQMSTSETSDNRIKARQRIDELTVTPSGQRLLALLEGYQPDSSALWGLMEASAVAMFTSSIKGEIRFFFTSGRLLVLFLLVSRMGLPRILMVQPPLPLLGLINDVILCCLLLTVFVSVVHTKMLEVFNFYFSFYFRTMKALQLETPKESLVTGFGAGVQGSED